jgi:hypothetical protein
MKRVSAFVSLPTAGRWGRRPLASESPAAPFVEEAVEAWTGEGPRSGSGSLRAWFRSGQLGPGAGVEDARGTGSRC